MVEKKYRKKVMMGIFLYEYYSFMSIEHFLAAVFSTLSAINAIVSTVYYIYINFWMY